MSDQTSPCLGQSKPLKVLITIDVEEEGLFSGCYRRRDASVHNVSHLPRLAPLSTDLTFPLTLLCSHAVFTNKEACKTLATMRDHYGAEIGAHLHHWSTPPYENQELYCQTSPPRTHTVPRDILEARLQALLDAGYDFQGAPLTSFRMGRWDLRKALFPLLQQNGIKADSSISPLRAYGNDGANHFLAPSIPWWPLGKEAGLLEIPITQIPLCTSLASLWYRLFAGTSTLDSFHFFAAVSASPFWHQDAIMKLCVRLLKLRKMDVLCVFWHSTEIVAKCSPHVPTIDAQEKVLRRLFAFFTWLKENFCVQGITMTQLQELALAEQIQTCTPHPDPLGHWS